MAPSLYLYLLLYLCSFLFVMNCDDWFLIWLGMEINMLSFVFLIYKQSSMNNIECCLKYFFIQSLGSVLFMSMFYMSDSLFMFFGGVILSYKMGAGPFFFWFPSICSGMEWMGCMILMTFQKFIPLMLMTSILTWGVWIILMVSLIIGTIGSFNQKEMKRLMAYSSIHHVGWILMCMLICENLWLEYILMYFMMIFPLFLILSKLEVNLITSLFNHKSKWSMMILMLSLGGMPPFLGFYLKWIILYIIMKINWFMVMFMILMSVIMLYVYIRIIYDFFMGFKYELSWMYYSTQKPWFLYMDMYGVSGLMIGCMVGMFLIF